MNNNKILRFNQQKMIHVVNSIKNKDGYCPCRILKEDVNMCICKDVREGGKCICGLFNWVEDGSLSI